MRSFCYDLRNFVIESLGPRVDIQTSGPTSCPHKELENEIVVDCRQDCIGANSTEFCRRQTTQASHLQTVRHYIQV
jgi:hypothetical protein